MAVLLISYGDVAADLLLFIKLELISFQATTNNGLKYKDRLILTIHDKLLQIFIRLFIFYLYPDMPLYIVINTTRVIFERKTML